MAQDRQPLEKGSLVTASIASTTIVGIVTEEKKVQILTSTFPGDSNEIGEERIINPEYWQVEILGSPDEGPFTPDTIKALIERLRPAEENSSRTHCQGGEDRRHR